MNKFFTALRQLLARLSERDAAPDSLDRLSIRDWADLPASHPRACEG